VAQHKCRHGSAGPLLFTGSICDGIGYGLLDPTPDDIAAPARAVCVHDVITRPPYDYDTQTEQRGRLCQLEQRQLLSFARARLVRPRRFSFR
jgi:ATP-binding cassette subfamily B protein